MDVDYLRGALREDAQLVGVPEPDLYERVRERRQRSDRRRLGLVAAGLAALLVGVAIPLSLISLRAADESGQVANPGGAETPNPSGIPGILGLPTRGSLAGDPDFLEQVRQLPWAFPGLPAGADPAEFPDPPVETRHVVFAGDVALARLALVAGQPIAESNGPPFSPPGTRDPGDLQQTPAAWFGGPLGATADQMQPISYPRDVVANLPASLYDGATGTLVIVAAPGDVIEISARPEVNADGTVSRDFVQSTPGDGVAVTALDPSPYLGSTAIQYRVTRDGNQVAVGQNPVPISPAEEPVIPYIELIYLRGQVDAVPDGALDIEQRMAAEILGEFGLGPHEVELLVHYEGPVPGVGSALSGLTVLTATFPSGAVLTRAQWIQLPESDPAAGAYGGRCVDELSAAGIPASQRIVAMRCDVVGFRDPPDETSTLVVIAPASLADGYAVAVGTSGTVTLDLADGGISMAEFPEGAETVIIQATDGSVLAEVPIFTQ